MVGNIACMGNQEVCTELLLENPKERENLIDLHVGGRIVLKLRLYEEIEMAQYRDFMKVMCDSQKYRMCWLAE
jgi:hypothetical protein